MKVGIGMIVEHYNKLGSKRKWLSTKQFKPFPDAEARAEWQGIFQDAKIRWISIAEEHENYTWPALRMDKYLDASRNGDLDNYLKLHWERRSILGAFVIAECIEGKHRFLDQIVNGVFAICEETSWMQASSNRNDVLPNDLDPKVDLASSETASLLAWTAYLLEEAFNTISPQICQRIEREVRERIVIPYLEHDDYWWLGFQGTQGISHWNPWCNSNVLMCLLILEKDNNIREQGMHKIMRSLDKFIETYPLDGSSVAGPMYWGRSGGGLYDCLELLKIATNHKLNLFDELLIKNIGRYPNNVHIHDHYVVDFADGDAKAGFDWDVVYSYGRAIKDELLTQLGASAPKRKIILFNWFSMYRTLRNIFQEKDRIGLASKAPYIRDAWMSHIQVMTARQNEGTEKGLYLAAKGGHNEEPHNHNDIGNFIVYADGQPVLIDLGTEIYRMQTFGPDRYELWHTQSAYHNLPSINGVTQQFGRSYHAKHVLYEMTEQAVQLSMDLSEAYPKSAGILSWQRTCRLLRGKQAFVEIVDDFELNEPTKEVVFSLMAAVEPIQITSGTIQFEYKAGKRVVLEYDANVLSCQIETIPLVDTRLQENWGTDVYRVVLELQEITKCAKSTLRMKQI